MARYQYETSPRKIEPEQIHNRIKKKKTATKKQRIKKEIVKKAKENAKLKNIVRIKRRNLIAGIGFAFLILLAISYRNSLINESFSEVKSLKNELSTIEKENEQLQVSIESSINLKNIEKTAEEQLGMQRLSPEQKVYVTIPKKDYVEPASEEIKTEEEKSIIQKIIDFIKGE